MRILITRPFDDSQQTAKDLAGFGIDSLIAPLSTIRYLHPVIPSRDYQAVIFTSRHAARHFVQHYPVPFIPAFCVGDETAAALAGAQFTAIHSADGDMIALRHLINTKIMEKTAPLLRLHAQMDSDPLYDSLIQDGFDITRVPLYAAEKLPTLSDAAIQALQRQTLDGICFYSPNAARFFVDHIIAAGLTEACRHMTAWCISNNTQAALRAVPFGRVKIADHPHHRAMIDIMTHDCE